jgi:hypothetical protein
MIPNRFDHPFDVMQRGTSLGASITRWIDGPEFCFGSQPELCGLRSGSLCSASSSRELDHQQFRRLVVTHFSIDVEIFPELDVSTGGRQDFSDT